MAIASVKSDSGFVDNWQSGKSLAECNLHMFTSEDSCDVSFRVGKNKKTVRAHRYILISRSCVFHAMLCGPLAEKNEITVPDVEAGLFTELLRFLYTDESEPTPVNVTGLLYLAKKYAVGGLEHLCLTYLKSSLSAENACVILEQAHVFDEKQLYDTALKVILQNGEKCLGTDGFRHLCRECFDKVITSDYLDVKALQVFRASLSWTENECKRQGREITPDNQRSALGETLYAIPFPDIEQTYYLKDVLPSKILTSDENVIIMAHIMEPERDPSPFRKRGNQGKAVTQSPSMTSVPTSTDVIFYRQHTEVGNAVRDQRKFTEASNWLKRLKWCENVTGTYSFTCSHDVRLLGVYVYGSAARDDRYSLEVRRHLSKGSWPNYTSFIKSDYQSSVSSRYNQHHIKEITLEKPFYIKKDEEYYVSVSMNGGRWLEFEGDGLLTQVTAGQCSFAINETGPTSLVYGLIFKSKTLVVTVLE